MDKTTNLESSFYDFMSFGSEQDNLLSSQYLDFFAQAERVLELAPGRGEFMRRLQAQGKHVVGVDIDEGMVKEAQNKGLDVTLRDALSFLRETSDKFDGIFCSHFIEHLTSEQLIELLRLCRNVLVEGGILVIAAPNPASLHIMLQEFWRDATHVRPYNLELLHFLFDYTGFEVVASGGNPNRCYQAVGSSLLRSEEEYDEVDRFPRIVVIVRRFIANLLIKLALGPKINRINDRLMLLEQAIQTMYPSNEIYIVGKCP